MFLNENMTFLYNSFFMMTGELLYTPAEEVVILLLHTKTKQVGSSTCMYKIDHIRWTKVMDWLTGKNTSGKGKHVHRHVSFHSNQKTEIPFSKKPMANLPAYVPPWFLWLNKQKCHEFSMYMLRIWFIHYSWNTKIKMMTSESYLFT